MIFFNHYYYYYYFLIWVDLYIFIPIYIRFLL